MRYLLTLPTLLFVLLAVHPAAASDIVTGRATALDGMTIVLSTPGQVDTQVRLWGVEAPALGDSNGDGWFARAVLDDILARGGHMATCNIVDRLGSGRVRAVCTLNAPGGTPGRDVGLAMIEAGWALFIRDFRQEAEIRLRTGSAQQYEQAEQAARRARRGRWARMPGN